MDAKVYRYSLAIDTPNIEIKKLAKKNGRSLRSEINTAIAHWLKLDQNESSKKKHKV